MQSVLNKKILGMIAYDRRGDYLKQDAANEIEILVLNEKIKLLKDCYFQDNNNNQVLQIKISELTQQLNQLKI